MVNDTDSYNASNVTNNMLVLENVDKKNKLYIITSGSLVFSLHHNAIAAAHCRQLFPHQTCHMS